MHTGMAEIDMHEVRIAAVDEAHELLKFAAIEQRLFPSEVFQVESADEISWWTWQNLDIVEWIRLLIRPLSRHNESLVAMKSRDLSVNVAHFLFQESRAVTGYNGSVHGSGNLTSQKGNGTSTFDVLPIFEQGRKRAAASS